MCRLKNQKEPKDMKNSSILVYILMIPCLSDPLGLDYINRVTCFYFFQYEKACFIDFVFSDANGSIERNLLREIQGKEEKELLVQESTGFCRVAKATLLALKLKYVCINPKTSS